jgi:hypothetical protein
LKMAINTYYTDLNAAGTGHAGSIGDKFSFEDFRLSLKASNSGVDGEIYNVEGYKEHDEIAGTFSIENKRKPVTIQSTGSVPARIKILGQAGTLIPTSTYSTVQDTEMVTLKRIVLQVDNSTMSWHAFHIRFGGPEQPNQKFIAENCVLIGSPGAGTMCIWNQTGTVILKGTSIIINSNAQSFKALNGNSFTLDSVYIENATDIFNGCNGGSYKNCAFFKYSGIVGGGTISDAGGNILAPSGATQLAGVFNSGYNASTAATSSYMPIAGSTGISGIRDNGDAALGLAKDLLDIDRTYNPNPDIGAVEYVASLDPVNSFNSAPLRDGNAVVSTIIGATLITKIQADSTDSYFDNINKVSEVDVFYSHASGRQKKRIKHVINGADLKGNAVWSTNSQAGVWTVDKVRTIDKDGAEHVVPRSVIGTDSDLTLS